MYNILVCDDDKEIVEAIEIYLTQEGYRILKAYDGTEALEMLEREEVHLLLLDVMMPKLDGIRATLKIREKNSIPIIILSAKSEDADKILGLNVGADDYVTKPFSPLELVARVKSQLRRYTQLGGTAQNENDKIYSVGGLRINDDPEEAAVIHVDGRRMWRVLENIFGNAAKYAMPGTRVYADLSVSESEVKFSLKNVSEQQLNISADELTERFIRGDISRSTEGSGLGLSIAKSLTEMQGGVFELYLDGDLFKVDIRFPRIKPM